MNTYVVTRTSNWLSEEELAASGECLPAVVDTLSDHVRWIRSYVFQEPDGTFSANCVFEATSVEWLSKVAEAMMLPPADSIRRVHRIAAPDLQPVA
jgi:hypothetical protein